MNSLIYDNKNNVIRTRRVLKPFKPAIKTINMLDCGCITTYWNESISTQMTCELCKDRVDRIKEHNDLIIAASK